MVLYLIVYPPIAESQTLKPILTVFIYIWSFFFAFQTNKNYEIINCVVEKEKDEQAR